MTIPDRGGPEPVDSLNMIGHFGFCTIVKVNVITKVLSDSKEFSDCIRLEIFLIA